MKLTAKIVVLGAPGVGKSSFAMQFALRQFPDEYEPILKDSLRKIIDINGREVGVDVLDPESQEETDEIRHWYLNDRQGFVLIYSVTSQESFDKLSEFKDQIHSVKGTDRVPMILIGNKSDMEHERVIPTNDGAALATSWNIPFMEASARRQADVDVAFSEVASQVLVACYPVKPNSNNGGASLSKCAIQ